VTDGATERFVVFATLAAISEATTSFTAEAAAEVSVELVSGVVEVSAAVLASPDTC
jgi:hypothetical protein